eukprot:CAMPEP_0114548090 /NCGR_PEP_ID=MMETSP0114-20121206/4795_1 /TAXON_ID=31324 /ORGANISM="Goniomonas sp, Strain m" /LENGTH=1039 /DNA_ID=CAMNT_0001732655 /DNA_START=138 /DNA_END=3257 /DNA_ORIENTATION=-
MPDNSMVQISPRMPRALLVGRSHQGPLGGPHKASPLARQQVLLQEATAHKQSGSGRARSPASPQQSPRSRTSPLDSPRSLLAPWKANGSLPTFDSVWNDYQDNSSFARRNWKAQLADPPKKLELAPLCDVSPKASPRGASLNSPRALPSPRNAVKLRAEPAAAKEIVQEASPEAKQKQLAKKQRQLQDAIHCICQAIREKGQTHLEAFLSFLGKDTGGADQKRLMSAEDFKQGIKGLKLDLTDAVVSLIVNRLDPHGTGEIQYSQFIKEFDIARRKREDGAVLLEQVALAIHEKWGLSTDAFAALDTDGDSALNMQELKLGIKALMPQLSKAQVTCLLNHAGVDPVAGMLSYRAFCAAFTPKSVAALGAAPLTQPGQILRRGNSSLNVHNIVVAPPIEPAEVQRVRGVVSRAIVSQFGDVEMAYRDWDTTSTGLAAGGLRAGLKRLGLGLTDQQMSGLLELPEKDKHGKISPADFKRVFAVKKRHEEPPSPVAPPPDKTRELRVIVANALRDKFPSAQVAFTEFDASGNGFVSPVELMFGLKKQGVGIDEAQATALVKLGDLDNDGVLSLTEFRNWFFAATVPTRIEKSAEEIAHDCEKAEREAKAVEVLRQNLGPRLKDRYGSLLNAFKDLDQSCNGLLSLPELMKAVRAAGFMSTPLSRVKALMLVGKAQSAARQVKKKAKTSSSNQVPREGEDAVPKAPDEGEDHPAPKAPGEGEDAVSKAPGEGEDHPAPKAPRQGEDPALAAPAPQDSVTEAALYDTEDNALPSAGAVSEPESASGEHGDQTGPTVADSGGDSTTSDTLTQFELSGEVEPVEHVLTEGQDKSTGESGGKHSRKISSPDVGEAKTVAGGVSWETEQAELDTKEPEPELELDFVEFSQLLEPPALKKPLRRAASMRLPSSTQTRNLTISISPPPKEKPKATSSTISPGTKSVHSPHPPPSEKIPNSPGVTSADAHRPLPGYSPSATSPSAPSASSPATPKVPKVQVTRSETDPTKTSPAGSPRTSAKSPRRTVDLLPSKRQLLRGASMRLPPSKGW